VLMKAREGRGKCSTTDHIIREPPYFYLKFNYFSFELVPLVDVFRGGLGKS